MKKKTTKKKQPENTNQCFTPAPPWVLNKTKKDCWFAGVNEGKVSSANYAEQEYKKKLEEVNIKEREATLQALRDITQGGASVLECMTKAFMAYQRY